jgi:sulfate permease, SulP family
MPSWPVCRRSTACTRSLLPTVAYALLGSSRQLVVGPEGSVSALVAVSVLSFAAAGGADAAELAAMLALLVGACYLVALVSRLGWLADYFSRPVLIGYIHGVAVVLIIGQLGKLTGIALSSWLKLDEHGVAVAGHIQRSAFADVSDPAVEAGVRSRARGGRSVSGELC